MDETMNLFSLQGRVAIVTGASSGLGAGFSVALARAGASVVLGARRKDSLEAVAARISKKGGRVEAQRCDVTVDSDCEALVDKAIESFGQLDILINNAGVGTAIPALLETVSEFKSVVDVNLVGSYAMARACARVMKPGASIVNISSALGLTTPSAPQAAYVSSKAAILGLTRDLSQQWAGRKGIRVNAIAPGYFASEMTDGIPSQQLQGFIERATPLKRLGQQHELDAAVVFLASNASSYITGTTLAVDGGLTGH